MEILFSDVPFKTKIKGNVSLTGSIMEHSTTLAEMARRDMLSLNVEFVKVSIARGRKLEVKMADATPKQEAQSRSNVVRFSGKYYKFEKEHTNT